jgi:hypothetical protein
VFARKAGGLTELIKVAGGKPASVRVNPEKPRRVRERHDGGAD